MFQNLFASLQQQLHQQKQLKQNILEPVSTTTIASQQTTITKEEPAQTQDEQSNSDNEIEHQQEENVEPELKKRKIEKSNLIVDKTHLFQFLKSTEETKPKEFGSSVSKTIKQEFEALEKCLEHMENYKANFDKFSSLVKTHSKAIENSLQDSNFKEYFVNIVEKMMTQLGVNTNASIFSIPPLFEKFSLPMSTKCYNLLLKVLMKKQQSDQAMQLFTEMKEKQVQPTAITFTTLIHGFCEQGDLDTAVELLEEMKQMEIERTTQTFTILINGFAKAGDINLVEKVIQQMQAENMIFDLPVHTAIVEAYGKNNLIEKAEEYFEKLKLSDDVFLEEKTISALIAIYCEHDYMEKAEALMEEMQQNGIQPSKFTYNSIMKGYVTNGNLNKAEETLQKMISEKMAVTNFQFRVLIVEYVQNKDMENAKRIYDSMIAYGFPGSKSFESYIQNMEERKEKTLKYSGNREEKLTRMIKNYLKNGTPQKAVDVLKQIAAEHISVPQVGIVYRTLLLLKRMNDLEGLEQTMSIMKQLQIPITPKEFNYLLDVCLKRGKVTLALEYINTMKEKFDLQLDRYCYTTLIAGFAKRGMIDESLALISRMRSDGLQVNIRVYSSLIDGLIRKGDKKAVISIMNEMRRHKLPINVVTWTSILNGLLLMGHLEDAMQTYRDMLYHYRVKPDVILYTTLMSGFSKAKAMHYAAQIFEDMKERECKPNEITFNALIHGHAQAGNFEQVNKLLQSMVLDYKYKPNVRTLTSIIDGLILHHRMKEAEEVFSIMKQSYIIPNIKTYTIFVKEYAETRQIEKVKQLVREMQEKYHIRPDVSIEHFVNVVNQMMQIVPLKKFECEEENRNSWTNQETLDFDYLKDLLDRVAR